MVGVLGMEFSATLSVVLAWMCPSDLLSGEVKLKVGSSDCRICFQPTLSNYCKTPPQREFFWFLQLSQSLSVLIVVLGKAKVFPVKYADLQNACAAKFFWMPQQPNLDRTMSWVEDCPLPNTSTKSLEKCLRSVVCILTDCSWKNIECCWLIAALLLGWVVS